MKSMAVSEFKAQALRALDEVAKSKESILVTKRGKPLAMVVPLDEREESQPGKLADALVFEEDIVSPLGEEMWEVCR